MKIQDKQELQDIAFNNSPNTLSKQVHRDLKDCYQSFLS